MNEKKVEEKKVDIYKEIDKKVKKLSLVQQKRWEKIKDLIKEQ